MSRVFLGLGSNLGDRLSYLQGAVDSMPNLIRCSRLYETLPVDAPWGSKPFLNAAVEIDYPAKTSELLQLVASLEGVAGRTRGETNAPRTLDVDVIYVDGFTSYSPEMVIPHPRAKDRAFVIAPMLDLDERIASELNCELASSLRNANESSKDEIYPGVVVVGPSLC